MIIMTHGRSFLPNPNPNVNPNPTTITTATTFTLCFMVYREMAHIMSTELELEVLIIDTSNEIAGEE